MGHDFTAYPGSDARLDAIYAGVKNCSGRDILVRIEKIESLLLKEGDREILEAVSRLDLLLDKLLPFQQGTRSEWYGRIRAELLTVWRHIMRGEYAQARLYLERASHSCCHMA
jgi:hypothetical protein